MNNIIKIYPIELLKKHYINNSLSTLPNIGKKKIEIINDYFFNNPFTYINEIKDTLELYYPNLLFDDEYIDEDTFDSLYNKHKWLNKLTMDDCHKNSIMKEFLRIETKKESNNIDFTPYNISLDPGILKDIDLKINTIDRISINNNWWKYCSINRHNYFCQEMIEKICNEEGHTWITDKDIEIYFDKNITNYKNVNIDLIKKCMGILINEGILVKYKNIYLLKKWYDKEKSTINIINELKDVIYDYEEITKADIFSDPNEKLSEEQINAINNIRCNLLTILNGPGGSGKTSKVIKGICNYEFNNYTKSQIIFLAPTHAARKNGIKTVGENQRIIFRTLHSMLQVTWREKTFDNTDSETDYSSDSDSELTPISDVTGKKKIYHKVCDLEEELNTSNCKYIIVDETSMVTLEMFYKLIKWCYKYYKSFNKEIHIVFIGDENQLPSIGVGNPFSDLVNYINTFTLTKNFRSNKDIVEHCNIIMNKDDKYKEYWTFKPSKNSIKDKFKNVKCLFLDNWKDELIKLLKEFKNRNLIPATNTSKDKKDIFQCISYKNSVCEEICPIIRNIFFNKKSKEVYDIYDYIVMKINVKGLFYNNDMGKIIEIDEGKYIIKLDEHISDNTVFKKDKDNNEYGIYKKDGIEHPIYINRKDNTITLTSNKYFKPNYCRTVHSSQGLQYPIVIYILENGYSNIKINYTACSRAQNSLYLLGNIDGFNKKNDEKKRNTLLSRIDITNKTSSKSIIKKIDRNYSMISKNLIINKRKNIPSKVKYDLWVKYNGNKMDGKCYVCEKNISIIDFHCGHVKSVKDGGDNNINNLRAICAPCNLSMGIQNLEEYKNKYY